MENRAAVFTSRPQAVEVYQAGAWWSGELLGWRHDADGSCQVWVRVVLGGVEETAWTDLATLRLPERHLSVAPEAAAAPDAPAQAPLLAAPYLLPTREMSVARHPSTRRDRTASVDSSTTASLPAVRDLSVVPDPSAPSSRGRRRAPEEPAAPAGGRRRAPEEVPSTGGRRRAPEDAVASSPLIPSSAGASAGRHRAAADPGRHRTADTGLFPVVSGRAAEAPAVHPRRSPEQSATEINRAIPTVRAMRPEENLSGRAREPWTAPEGLEADLLTRPMRLSDHIPHARRPRLDGSLSGV
jgi:hypothetical protein